MNKDSFSLSANLCLWNFAYRVVGAAGPHLLFRNNWARPSASSSRMFSWFCPDKSAGPELPRGWALPSPRRPSSSALRQAVSCWDLSLGVGLAAIRAGKGPSILGNAETPASLRTEGWHGPSLASADLPLSHIAQQACVLPWCRGLSRLRKNTPRGTGCSGPVCSPQLPSLWWPKKSVYLRVI